MNDFYTTQEVADRLGVSVFTIRRYIRGGMLRAVKLEGLYRVRRGDLAAFLSAREIGDIPEPPSGGPIDQPTDEEEST